MDFVKIAFYLGIGMYFVFIITIVILIWWIWNFYNKDIFLLFDKNMRWKMIFTDTKGKNAIKYKDSLYEINEEATYLNKKGRSLNVYCHDKYNPLKIDYNGSQWLDGKSIQALINNEIVKEVVKPSENLIDRFFWLIVLLSIISTIIVSVVALKVFNVF